VSSNISSNNTVPVAVADESDDDLVLSGSFGSPGETPPRPLPGKTPGGHHGHSGSQNNMQGLPHPLQKGSLLGPGGLPVVRLDGVGPGLIIGSFVVGIVVGWGFGMIVVTLGGRMIPPITVVEDPCVCVTVGS
jgi:hypothetical protein